MKNPQSSILCVLLLMLLQIRVMWRCVHLFNGNPYWNSEITQCMGEWNFSGCALSVHVWEYVFVTKMNVTRFTITQMNLTQNDKSWCEHTGTFISKEFKSNEPLFSLTRISAHTDNQLTWLTLMKEPNSKSNCGIGDEGIKVVVVVGGSFMLRFSKHKTMHCEFSQPKESLFICQVRMLISLVKVISFRIALLCFALFHLTNKKDTDLYKYSTLHIAFDYAMWLSLV